MSKQGLSPGPSEEDWSGYSAKGTTQTPGPGSSVSADIAGQLSQGTGEGFWGS